MKIIQFLMCFSVISALNLASPEVSAQSLEDLDPIAKNIKNAKEAALEVIKKAERVGDAMLLRAGNELSIAIQSVEFSISQVLDKGIKNLGEENDKIIKALKEITKKAEALMERTEEIEGTLVVDIKDILGDIRLFGEKTDFYLRRVKGTVFLEGDSNAALSLYGLGFGNPSSKRKSAISAFTLDGDNVDFEAASGTEANTTILTISPEKLKELHSLKTAIRKKATVTVSVSRGVERSWIARKLFRKASTYWSDPVDYKIDYYVLFIPSKVITAKLSYTKEEKQWRKVGERKDYEMGSHDASNGGEGDYREAIQRIGGGKKFAKPSFKVKTRGDGSGWSTMDVGYTHQSHHNQPTASIGLHDNDTTMKLTYHMWSRGFKFYMSADILEQKLIAVDGKAAQQKVSFGDSFSFSIPVNARNWTLVLEIPGFRDINVRDRNSSGLLSYDGDPKVGDRRTVNYSLAVPVLH